MVGYVMVIYDYDLSEYNIWHMMIDTFSYTHLISRRRVLTLAVILMSCSRLPQVAEVKRPMIVTLVGLLQVGASSYTAVIGPMARDVVSLRLL